MPKFGQPTSIRLLDGPVKFLLDRFGEFSRQ
jgi:hypothetical protein